LPKINESFELASSLKHRILEDLKLIHKDPIFPTIDRKYNAEKALSRFVSWTGLNNPLLKSESHTNLRELFNKYPNWKSEAKEFQAILKDPLLKAIDTKWMETLIRYSHWDFSSHPLVIKQLSKVAQSNGIERIGIHATLPLPDFREFRQWTYAYLLQQWLTGDMTKGHKIFRKMAQLANSTGLLIGQMIAVSMLWEEHILARHMKATNWILFDKKRIEAYKRLSWAWVGVVHSTWFHEYNTDYDPYFSRETGLCAAAWENTGGLTTFQDFLGNSIVFEKNFDKDIERSRAFQKRLLKACDMKSYESFLSPTPPEANPMFVRGFGALVSMNFNKNDSSTSLNWSRVPYIRQVVGLQIMTFAIPNYFGLYQQNNNQNQ
ncbi:MAG: hypothetical protein MJK18_02945, partial [Bdellovibrionales bacterium]|nr:hypothetical protein [Bdellovibrionales bacterium]